jgi:hypothetical protein
MPETKTQPEAAKPSPGIDKVDPQKVKDRAALLVQHGTNPLIAEKIAEDAEQAQLMRDKAYAELQEKRDEAANERAIAMNRKGGK